MKNLIAAISIMLAFFASAQATSKGASAPDFQNGQIKVDTAGTGIAKWAVYRVENGSRQDPAIAKDFSTASGLPLGTYWVLGKKKTDAFGQEVLQGARHHTKGELARDEFPDQLWGPGSDLVEQLLGFVVAQ